MNKFLWPLIAFIVLVVLLAIGLNLDPREVPSPLVGKPAPAFNLANLQAKEKNFAPADMQGKVWLLNVWSSWCVSCRQEHPILVDLAKRQVVPVVGLNYKEVRGDGGIDVSTMKPEAELALARQRADQWMAEHGNPYQLVALDVDGRVGIDYGVYGVPETYVIDKAGVIRYKQIGPITPEALEKKILPLVAELNK
ncbi:MAG TPA: DsbE family thiol:disulfide interchange protein [Azospira sp.]|nr:DsbE family thiol:disulfide interchange protein [Azospira sp.]